VSSTTLIIAIIGILGTLAATLITQWLTGKRDDRQWLRQKQLQDERFEREREQEALRWKRERKERREQWFREDAARLYKDRAEMYATLLSDCSRILDLLRVLAETLEDDLDREEAPATARKNVDDIEIAREEFYRASSAVEIIASSDLLRENSAVKAIVNDIFFDLLFIDPVKDTTGVSPYSERVAALADEMQQATDSLRVIIRRELGIINPTESSGEDGG
jgi:hypothetical protein